MNLKYLLAACIGSCLVYFVVFGFLVHKPLTIGAHLRYLEQKLEYLRELQGRKLVVLAGSNGRFSHRCETLEKLLGVPCANMSVQVGLSLDYQFARIEPYLTSGDVVYLPLEYKYYDGDLRSMMGGTELPVCVAYDKGQLLNLGSVRLLYALFYFDLKYLISGLGEMLLEAVGVERRFSVRTLTVNGDESGHTLEKAQEYRAAVEAEIEFRANARSVDVESYRASLVGDILRRGFKKGVIMIGGLPSTVKDYPIPDEFVAELRGFYAAHGQRFIALQNRSQYPSSAFYDTALHLSEPYQIAHTRALAPLLRAELGGGFPESRAEQ